MRHSGFIHYDIIMRILVVSTIVFFVIAIILWFVCTTNNGVIAGTEFYDMKRPVCGAENFDVDSKGNLYFAESGSGTVQIYDKYNQYLYALPLKKDGLISSGMILVRLTETDEIEVFDIRGELVNVYDQQGLLAGQISSKKYFEQNVPECFNAFSYSIEKDGSIYQAQALGFSIFQIYRVNGAESAVVFTSSTDQLCFMAARTLAILCFAAVCAISAINRYIIQKRQGGAKFC